MEAYQHLNKILEQANAIMATFLTGDKMEEEARKVEEEKRKRAQKATVEDVQNQMFDWSMEELDDSDIYFDPAVGNVIFASAIDGWAFRWVWFLCEWKLVRAPYPLRDCFALSHSQPPLIYVKQNSTICYHLLKEIRIQRICPSKMSLGRLLLWSKGKAGHSTKALERTKSKANVCSICIGQYLGSVSKRDCRAVSEHKGLSDVVVF